MDLKAVAWMVGGRVSVWWVVGSVRLGMIMGMTGWDGMELGRCATLRLELMGA